MKAVHHLSNDWYAVGSDGIWQLHYGADYFSAVIVADNLPDLKSCETLAEIIQWRIMAYGAIDSAENIVSRFRNALL